ncbi:magnesium transporter [Adhaeretor mobilis]|uniref:Magnesium transporter MgtE n=1 Tax=Adhaeretor mobilis TaxID=1930276 RepID=A0A517MWH1_9BACT|nr:magnesium transporter [Adhaeretor mobilis]QDS99157.1 Magnesium transporter MgtE [Adhaeretor mobilis]
MINTLYLPEIREMLASDDEQGLNEFCTALHAARTAEFMEGLSSAEAWQVLLATDATTRVDVFTYLPEQQQVDILESADPQEASDLIANMPHDDRVDLLKEVEDVSVDSILPLLPTEERRDIQRLSQHPEGTAGAVMTSDMARLPETLTVREALEEVARQSADHETIYYIYIVDEENHLRGLVSARQLVTNLGRPNKLISDLMERDLLTVTDTDDQETVASKVAEYDFLAIPVVDSEQHLVGIITHDDVIDVLREEAEEDAYLAGAVEPLDETYMETPWYTLAWKRGVWLTVLFVAAMLTAAALKGYEDTLAKVTWLVLFIPLVISSGGNSGTQSTTLVIRGLTNKDLVPGDWLKVVRREIITGLCLGSFLAMLGFFVVRIVQSELTTQQALVVPITLLSVVICGTIVGSLLPLLFRRLGLDEALMSSPFLTGIIDIAGIVIYMSVAIFMLEELGGGVGAG